MRALGWGSTLAEGLNLVLRAILQLRPHLPPLRSKLASIQPPQVGQRLIAALVAHRPQPSSASRLTDSQAEFFILSQSGERPER